MVELLNNGVMWLGEICLVAGKALILLVGMYLFVRVMSTGIFMSFFQIKNRFEGGRDGTK